MSDQAKTSVPWNQPGGESGNPAGTESGGSQANLLQVPCPECGQMLALGREYLGGHCLCSVCDGLMLVSLKTTGASKMAVVAEKVDKMTGEKVGDSPSTLSPEAGGAGMEEDWENTRPVKMWQGSVGGELSGEDDELDLGVTMPIPKMDVEDVKDLGATMPVPGIANTDDELDLGVTMPIPKMDVEDVKDLGATMPVPGIANTDDDMDLGVTMPIPKMDVEEGSDTGAAMSVPTQGGAAGKKKEIDDDWAMTDPVKSQHQSQGGSPWSTDAGLPWEKSGTGRQAVKLAPPGTDSGRVPGKAPSPTSGAVPTLTTPPTKAPPPTTGSVPTLDSGKIAARSASGSLKSSQEGGLPPWQPPGASAPIGQAGRQAAPAGKTGEKGAVEAKKAATEKKKSDPFGNKPSSPAPIKKPQRRRRKSHKGVVVVAFLFLLLLGALAVFIFAPGVIPRGLEAREFIDGKVDKAKEKLENLLAERAMDSDEPADSPGGAVIGGTVATGATTGSEAGQGSGTGPALVVQTRESDLALQKLLKQEGERVIHRFYGASTVEEKLAFVVDPEEARPDMEKFFAEREGVASIRSILFRGGTRDLETGYYYGVFDVIENENDVPHRWCVVDAGTGLYQVDWILYRQIVASELGSFLVNPSSEGVPKSFHMLVKLGGNVSADDSPWFEEAVSVELQVPLISSAWYPVLMKKPLAESRGLTTKLMDGKMVIAVVEVAWIPGDKDPGKTTPAITAIKRWGAWGRRDF